MKLLTFIACLSFGFACGRAWRSNPNKDTSTKNLPAKLDQWTGRSDYTDTRWQIKSQP